MNSACDDQAESMLSEDIERWRTDGRRPPLFILANRFWGTLDAIRETVPLVEVHVPIMGKPDQSPEEAMVAWVSHMLPAATQARLLSAFQMMSVEESDEVLDQATSQIEQIFTRDPALLSALAAGTLREATAMKPSILLSAMLVSAVSAFEALADVPREVVSG